MPITVKIPNVKKLNKRRTGFWGKPSAPNLGCVTIQDI